MSTRTESPRSSLRHAILAAVIAFGATGTGAVAAPRPAPNCVIVVDARDDEDGGSVDVTPWDTVSWPVDEPALDILSGSLTTVGSVLRVKFAMRDVDAASTSPARGYVMAADVMVWKHGAAQVVATVAVFATTGTPPAGDKLYDDVAAADPSRRLWPRNGVAVARRNETVLVDGAVVTVASDPGTNVVTVEARLEDLYRAEPVLRRTKTLWLPRFATTVKRTSYVDWLVGRVASPEASRLARPVADFAIAVDYHSSGRPLNYAWSSVYTIGGGRCPATNRPRAH